MKRYAVSVSYVGSKFSGWANQTYLPYNKTVCGMVDEALNRLCGKDAHSGAIVSSRTDSGVHALFNTFHVDINRAPRSSSKSNIVKNISPFESRELIGGINAHLIQLGAERDILILGATQVDPAVFHARFSALSREYVYRIIPCASISGSKMGSCDFRPVVRDGVAASPLFEVDRAWCMNKQENLDIDAMKKASKYFLGVHDFTSFRGPDCSAKSPIREVSSIHIESMLSQGPSVDQLTFKDTPIITVKIRAPRFLHRMVRNIVGAIVTVGKGLLKPDEIPFIIEAKDRQQAPICAPACGLYLTDVEYEKTENFYS